MLRSAPNRAFHYDAHWQVVSVKCANAHYDALGKFLNSNKFNADSSVKRPLEETPMRLGKYNIHSSEAKKLTIIKL